MAGSFGANSQLGSNQAAQTALGLGGSDSAVASYQQTLTQIGNRSMTSGNSPDPTNAQRHGDTPDKPESNVSRDVDICTRNQPYELSINFSGCTPVVNTPGSPPSGPGPAGPTGPSIDEDD